MTNLILFDPRSKDFKRPFGAVKCCSRVKFQVKVLRIWGLKAEIIIFDDNEGRDSGINMNWCGADRGFDIYSCDFFSSNMPGLVWYCFKITSVDGSVFFFGKNGLKNDLDEVFRYQLTVFGKDYETPAWFSEGVTYHIFVDRFFCAENQTEHFSDDYFYVHKNKKETPIFLPNKDGVVENRDIYGGNIAGIKEKLPYLNELGVKTIYLSPIFEAWSNHKYDTANYKKIASHFGSRESLISLCNEAKKYGMRIILDGVFNHTGSDSIYFDKNCRYGGYGAFWNENSKYREWFTFDENGEYSSWWGIDTLPQVNELALSYQKYIIDDDDSVIAWWMNAGISGWRLDVADELPDEFIEKLKVRSRWELPEAIVVGEVWEDASNKKAYGEMKKYFTEGILDGVMNYPLRNAILRFLKGEMSSKEFSFELASLTENYPDISQRCLMNIIGTHDTVRAVNELSVGTLPNSTKKERAERYLTEKELGEGKRKLRQAAVLQYMFPGSPCIYYGDEIGMQGFEDPFNRRYFTWDNMDGELLGFYRQLGKIKTDFQSMKDGDFKVKSINDDVIMLNRGNMRLGFIVALVNRGRKSCLIKLNKGCEIVLKSMGCIYKNGILKLSSFSYCIISCNGNI